MFSHGCLVMARCVTTVCNSILCPVPLLLHGAMQCGHMGMQQQIYVYVVCVICSVICCLTAWQGVPVSWGKPRHNLILVFEIVLSFDRFRTLCCGNLDS
jgi:hypothetical protein